MTGPGRAIIPPRIAPGQTLGIVAPAGPVNAARFGAGLACLGDVFRIRVADSVLAPHAPNVPSYLAASDDARAAELAAMIADPDVRAILLARGGYGLMRILPRLDPAALRADPKPIIGFSDGTALLAWAHAAGVRGVHGPMVVQLERLPPLDVAHLIALISEPRAPGVRPWSLVRHGGGQRRGALVAANLTLASLLAGTPWPLPLPGAIAVFEEVGEKPYALDRYLTQLALVGALGSLAAAIVGDLTRCTDPNPPTGVPDPEGVALATVVERLRAAGVPAASGAPIGHGDRNEAVPFGADTIVDFDAGTVEIVEPAVA
jgi:muramoyltetrapeptide carboxypeptidase